MPYWMKPCWIADHSTLTPKQDSALKPFHFLNQIGFKALSIDSSPRIPLTQKWLKMLQDRASWAPNKKEVGRASIQPSHRWSRPCKRTQNYSRLLENGKSYQNLPTPPWSIVRIVGIVTAAKEEKIHAVNQLIPLLTKAADELMIPVVPALQVEELSPGIHQKESVKSTSSHSIWSSLLKPHWT